MNNTKELILKAKKLHENKNFSEAKSFLLQALDKTLRNDVVRLNLYILISDISYKINDFDDAEKYLLKYIETDKSNSNIFNSLGNIYQKKRDYKNSEKFYLQAVGLEEGEKQLSNLAILYQNLGKIEKAKKYYNKVLNKNSKNIGALYNLSNIDKSIIDEKKVKTLKKLVNEKKINYFDLASCFFLLAKNEKKKKNFKKEINFLESANNFSYKDNKIKNKQFDKYWLEIIPKKYDKIEYVNDNGKLINTNNFFPIFIIGLPRCGSTLIESIISSGIDEVENLGETNLVNWAFLNTNREFLKESQNNNKEEKVLINFKDTASKLIKAFSNLNLKNIDKCFFSEKSLENFYYIDLIVKIFPNAKFINPHRNLVDNIFAIYCQFLSRVSWSHSIENILLYLNNYLSVMETSKRKYKDRIFSVSLEELSNDPRKISLEIYKFCNLKWDEKCLEFYKRNDLFSNTASNNQIRSSIQKYDKKKYENYKSILNSYVKKYNWIELS